MADGKKYDNDEVEVEVPAVVDDEGDVEPITVKTTPEQAEQIQEAAEEEVEEARSWYTIWWIWLIIIIIFGFGFWGFGTFFWW